jgi:hypothetical protein
MAASVEAWLAKSRRHFTSRAEQALVAHKRLSDLKRQFEIVCRGRYPGLPIIWLTRHTGPLKKLLTQHTGAALAVLMREYVSDERHHPTGVSFDSFYLHANHLTTIVTDRAARAQTVATRAAIAEPPPPPATELETFQQTPFFAKLPPIFQQKIREQTQTLPKGAPLDSTA